MAYDTQELKEKSLSVIEEHQLYFISDVVAFLPCDKTTFYNHFPVDSNDFNDIRKRLDANKINDKVKLRRKWLKSDNATMQMGIMKLLSEDEELKKLAMEYKEHSGEIKLPTLSVEVVKPDES